MRVSIGTGASGWRSRWRRHSQHAAVPGRQSEMIRFRYRSAGPGTYMVHTDVCPSGGLPIHASILIGRVRNGAFRFVNCQRCGGAGGLVKP